MYTEDNSFFISRTRNLSKNLVWKNSGKANSNNSGVEVIARAAEKLPNLPGVYRMLNAEEDVLYVGKAKSLKKRVTSYARSYGHSNRIMKMIHETTAMEFITTNSETEALLLEANLIKCLRPRFNVLLRDDKSFPYIVITNHHEAPGLFKHRGARNNKHRYFGPFASAKAVNHTINTMQKAFLIRTCSDSEYANRTRPCLLYQIKRCAAPCTKKIETKTYKQLVREADNFLSGKSRQITSSLSQKMQRASSEFKFEQAAVYRDRIAALAHIQSHQGINPKTLKEADVFAVAQQAGVTCIQVFFFRTGQNWGNKAYFPIADKTQSSAEILKAFLAQFYDGKPCPKLILLPNFIDEMDLLQQALSESMQHKVVIKVPQRGEKKELVQHASKNAHEALGRKLAETSSQVKLLNEMAETFYLDKIPERIEVYDNSHIMGTNAVGAMIVSGKEGLIKNQYRKFNIKSENLVAGDDYAMMREVILRRFLSLKKIDIKQKTIKSAGDWPDLIIIDGGRGQLNAVDSVIQEMKLERSVALIAIAKGANRNAGREKFFLPGRTSFMLPARSPVLYFVQKLRDEAHRFAIVSHRSRRKIAMRKNPLDAIAGVGSSRKRSLLHHFGSTKAIEQAGVADLKAVTGISEQMAQLIYNYFHENN